MRYKPIHRRCLRAPPFLWANFTKIIDDLAIRFYDVIHIIIGRLQVISEVLSEIVEKNTQALRPNNKINSSVVLEEKTLRIAECIAKHSEKSITRVLSSMLDAASIEFIGLYRDMLSPDERALFDQALLETMPSDQVFGLVYLSPSETMAHANLISWFPDAALNEPGDEIGAVHLWAGLKDGQFGAWLPGKADKPTFMPMDRSEMSFHEDAKFRNESILFSRVNPCQEKSIHAVFAQSSWIDIGGVLYYIEPDCGAKNLEALVKRSVAVDENFNLVEDKDDPSSLGFPYDADYRAHDIGIRPSLWTCLDRSQGLWSYQGTTFQFFTGTYLSTYELEEGEHGA